MIVDDPDVAFAPRLGVVLGFLDELRELAKDTAR